MREVINWKRKKIQNIPEFEMVTIRKRIHTVRDLSVYFDYFFEKDESKPFLSDINSGVDLSYYKHHTFFPKYDRILNKIKRGYEYDKLAFVQKIRLDHTDFLKEIRKLLISEGAFRPLLR